MSIACYGSGSPTVILVAGVGLPASLWDQVYPTIMSQTTICPFELTAVDDLHALLMKAGVQGPYILAGHSLAGLHARLFFSRWPQEVAAIALIDSAHPDMAKRWLARVPQQSPNESLSVTNLRGMFTDMVSGLETLAAPVRAAGSLGSLPLAVLTEAPGKILFGVSAEIDATLNQEWQLMQNDLATLSTNSVHLVSNHAGHVIPQDDPDLVIGAILDLLKKVKK